jgi:hypothetical protein
MDALFPPRDRGAEVFFRVVGVESVQVDDLGPFRVGDPEELALFDDEALARGFRNDKLLY